MTNGHLKRGKNEHAPFFSLFFKERDARDSAVDDTAAA